MKQRRVGEREDCSGIDGDSEESQMHLEVITEWGYAREVSVVSVFG